MGMGPALAGEKRPSAGIQVSVAAVGEIVVQTTVAA